MTVSVLTRFDVAAGATFFVPFTSFASTGASSTISAFILGDIAIYKNGGTTPRTSTNGIVLLDTDGINFGGITGINGFSVDLSDNTDASFYAVGSEYWIVLGPITVDAQTVNFVAAWFRIVSAETVTGVQSVNVTHGAAVAWASGAITSSVLGSDAITAAKVAADVGTEFADSLLDRDMSTGTDSGSPSVRTVRQALRFLRNKWSISGTTLTVTKEDDATAAWTSILTATAGADPVTGSDPA